MTVEYVTDHELIERALIKWLGEHTGIARWINHPVGRPPNPYGTIQYITDGVQRGIDATFEKHNATTDKMETVTHGVRSMTIQCTVYTDVETGPGQRNARNRLVGAVGALRTGTVQREMNDAGLAYMRALTGVQGSDEQLGDRWERRATVDLEFNYISLVTDKPTDPTDGQWIDTFDGTTITAL